MLQFHGASDLDRALALLAEHLAASGVSRVGLLIAGGAALNLLGLMSRTTRDVDVVAIIRQDERGGVVPVKARPLPPAVAQAARLVAEDLGLPQDWLNPGPTDLLDFGLPHHALERAERRQYGSTLTIYVLQRWDLIHLKLYAAVDQGGGRHLADLLELKPTADEILAAAQWARTHDPSESFRDVLRQLVRDIGFPDVAERL